MPHWPRSPSKPCRNHHAAPPTPGAPQVPGSGTDAREGGNRRRRGRRGRGGDRADRPQGQDDDSAVPHGRVRMKQVRASRTWSDSSRMPRPRRKPRPRSRANHARRRRPREPRPPREARPPREQPVTAPLELAEPAVQPTWQSSRRQWFQSIPVVPPITRSSRRCPSTAVPQRQRRRSRSTPSRLRRRRPWRVPRQCRCPRCSSRSPRTPASSSSKRVMRHRARRSLDEVARSDPSGCARHGPRS